MDLHFEVAYLQIMIRRREPDPLWAWAVEMERSFSGSVVFLVKRPRSLKSSRARHYFNSWSAAGDVVRYRREIELAEADDILFCSWDASRFSRTQSAFRRIMR
jgi:hypothetical protein